jgi:hypothetical protein
VACALVLRRRERGACPHGCTSQHSRPHRIPFFAPLLARPPQLRLSLMLRSIATNGPEAMLNNWHAVCTIAHVCARAAMLAAKWRSRPHSLAGGLRRSRLQRRSCDAWCHAAPRLRVGLAWPLATFACASG